MKDSVVQVVYIPHGGGPLPVIGGPGQDELVLFLKSLGSSIGEPSCIVVCSAHWEEERATITSADKNKMLYDYYGMPQEAYQLSYPAPGRPDLAVSLAGGLEKSGILSATDAARGLDHGAFIPLMLMYPKAQIPVIQLSMLKGLDPRKHIELGESLAPYLPEDTLFVGSGMSFHNMQFLLEGGPREAGETFASWLDSICLSPSLSAAERKRSLEDWSSAPHAKTCHPREEHLVPLHVCFGIASKLNLMAKKIFDADVFGQRCLGFHWHGV